MNKKSKLKVRQGFTLTELMITAVIMVIIILAIGITMAGSVRGWRTAYGRAFSDVAMESYSARRAFDGVIRKAVRQYVDPVDLFTAGSAGSSEVTVRYYSSYLFAFPDRYARFYLANREVKLEHGSLDASGNKTKSGTTTVCSSVDSCLFKGDGRSIQMIIKLNNGTQSATIVSSAVLHNP